MRFNKNHFRIKRKGVVSVMALLILSMIMTSALTLASLLMDEVRMSLNVDNSIIAFYAAESGVEKALHRLKYSREASDFNLFDRLIDRSFDIDASRGLGFYITDKTTIEATDYTVYNISTSSPGHVNIIDPAGDISAIDWGIVSGYIINWQVEDCFPSHASDRLETTLNYFGINFTNQGTDKVIDVCNCAYGSNNCSVIIRSNISKNKYYSISFKPLDSTVNKLVFQLKNPFPPPVYRGIQSEAYIEVDGNYHNSSYRLKVRLPSLTPVSDLFSYVIFSEEDLVKDN